MPQAEFTLSTSRENKCCASIFDILEPIGYIRSLGPCISPQWGGERERGKMYSNKKGDKNAPCDAGGGPTSPTHKQPQETQDTKRGFSPHLGRGGGGGKIIDKLMLAVAPPPPPLNFCSLGDCLVCLYNSGRPRSDTSK